MNNTISIDNVYKIHGNNTILNNISFNLCLGEPISIIGPSGCGKTTLLYLLAGLDKPTSGKISIDYSKLKIAFILQDYGLFPWKTVEKNILLPLELKKTHPNIQKNTLKKIVKELKLDGLEKRYPMQLSGGQRQRVAIGRALIKKPDILLMDEPFSSLDAITRKHLQNTIIQLWKHRKITIITVTHSISEAVFLGKQILVLTQPPHQKMHILNNPIFNVEHNREHEEFFKLTVHIQRMLDHTHTDE